MCAAEAIPDIHEQRRQHFAAWEQGKAALFVIRCRRPSPPELPPFTFRKIDDSTIAILAWRDEAEAKKWCTDHRVDPTRVSQLPYSEFRPMLAPLSPADRRGYKLEVI
jgi:hypothetical protein